MYSCCKRKQNIARELNAQETNVIFHRSVQFSNRLKTLLYFANFDNEHVYKRYITILNVIVLKNILNI